MIICSKYGKEFNLNEHQCPSCNTKIEGIRVCPNCNIGYAIDKTTCDKCGSKLETKDNLNYILERADFFFNFEDYESAITYFDLILFFHNLPQSHTPHIIYNELTCRNSLNECMIHLVCLH